MYGHFIEPKMLLVREMKIQTGFVSNFVVIWDIDISTFNNKVPMEKISQEISSLNTDFVLFAWNIVWDAGKEKAIVADIVSPLWDLNSPSFFVSPENSIASTLLKSNGFTNISNITPQVNETYLIGLSSGIKWNEAIESIKLRSPEDHVIVINQDPDSILQFPENIADLSFSSTAGKRINIPFTRKYIFPSSSYFEKGLYNTEKWRTFITSGISDANFAFRFLNPPEIIKVETF